MNLRWRLVGILGLMLALCACQWIGGPENGAATRISYMVYNPSPPPKKLEIAGELRLPGNAGQRVPGVVILHDEGGVDGTGASYAMALKDAGIASLEIDMFGPRGQESRGFLKPTDNLPDVFGALEYLAGHPAIDAGRIGITGYSWGGALAVIAAVEAYVRFHFQGETRYAAHVSLYPICRRFQDGGSNSDVRDGSWTGAPILILAAEEDDYEAPESCPTFVAELPEVVRNNVSVHVYPGATHGFDSPRGPRTYFDRWAFLGKGGYVRQTPDPEAAEDARRRTVAFFRQAFAMEPASATRE